MKKVFYQYLVLLLTSSFALISFADSIEYPASFCKVLEGKAEIDTRNGYILNRVSNQTLKVYCPFFMYDSLDRSQDSEAWIKVVDSSTNGDIKCSLTVSHDTAHGTYDLDRVTLTHIQKKQTVFVQNTELSFGNLWAYGSNGAVSFSCEIPPIMPDFYPSLIKSYGLR